MLGKILKYEFKATARIFLLLYPALLLVALINALLLPMDAYNTAAATGATELSASGIMQAVYSVVIGIATVAYVVLVIGTLLMTLVISLLRFYNLLGKEGYLWLTLPTTINSHILGKLLCSLVWFVASTVVVILSMGILMMKTGWIESVPDVWATFVDSGLNVGLWIALAVAAVIVAWLSGVISFFAACAIGPNIMRSRLGGSAIAFIIIYCVEQTVAAAVLVLGAVLVSAQLGTFDPAADLMQTATSAASIDFIGLVFIGSDCALKLLLGVALYFLTRYFMTRKLNLT